VLTLRSYVAADPDGHYLSAQRTARRVTAHTRSRPDRETWSTQLIFRCEAYPRGHGRLRIECPEPATIDRCWQ
jgi:hypothetical protein